MSKRSKEEYVPLKKQDVTSNGSTDSLRNTLIAENDFPWVGFIISLFENYASKRLRGILFATCTGIDFDF